MLSEMPRARLPNHTVRVVLSEECLQLDDVGRRDVLGRENCHKISIYEICLIAEGLRDRPVESDRYLTRDKYQAPSWWNFHYVRIAAQRWRDHRRIV